METVVVALALLVVGFAFGRVKSLAYFQRKAPAA
jgi:hypothetical protein